jgi:hypothetical protein
MMMSSISSYACISAADMAWKVIENKNDIVDDKLHQEVNN